MTTRIEIDPNVRVRGNGTRAGLEDVTGPLRIGLEVEVYEPESGLVGPGRVTEIDPAKQLVFLSVEWHQLREGIEERQPATATPVAALRIAHSDESRRYALISHSSKIGLTRHSRYSLAEPAYGVSTPAGSAKTNLVVTAS
ncbi:hypothetical protein EDE04_3260 [Streptomyces sp. 2132.2]|uniref:hypothetical protein n=1 Tax=Streptomyces sp. 2132.2 TaxID=2485161 RepID=UPI000F4858DD|nr:hypothetical protein [Streptomyces sp. 2132.2]ROQ96791.1 hypothetical protein EDE04_3260 [Streptomyces sp. 2132.2]